MASWLSDIVPRWEPLAGFEESRAAFAEASDRVNAWRESSAVQVQGDQQDPPEYANHDVRATCDMDKDGTTDLVDTATGDVNRGLHFTATRALSGVDGHTLWLHNNGPHLKLTAGNLLPRHFVVTWWWPLPEGEFAKPQNWDSTDTDLDGDGTCDVLVLGTTGARVPICVPVMCQLQVSWYLALLQGLDGTEIWHADHITNVTFVGVQGVAPACYVEFTNVPTGLDFFQTPLGPRHVLVSHDWRWVSESCGITVTVNGITVTPFVYTTVTKVVVSEARENRILWNRALTYVSAVDFIYNLLRGEADLMGEGPQGPENEILLDRLDPDLYVCTVKTLRGRDGGDYWESAYSPVLRAGEGQFPNTEETREQLVACMSYFQHDLAGDGIPEVIGSVLTRVAGADESSAHLYRTHWSIFDGTAGRKLWNKDIRTQGWGYLESMDVRTGPRSDPVPYVVVAATDTGIGTSGAWGTDMGARFPKRFTHLTVLKLESGVPVWSRVQEWGQHSELPYYSSMYQFLGDGAVFPYGYFNGATTGDLTGDGVREVITAADFRRPTHALQVLLSQQTHQYHVHDVVQDLEVRRVEAWGGHGMALPCGTGGFNLTVLGGNSRRLDLHRFDLATDDLTWRQPVYNDSTISPMRASRGLRYIVPMCRETQHGANAFLADLYLESVGRGREGVPVRGSIGNPGRLRWVLPELDGKPPLNPSLRIDEMLYAPPEQASLGARLFVNLAPMVPGGAVGFGIASAVGRSIQSRRRAG